MTIIESIVKAGTALITWLTVKGIDSILSRWVARATVWWESRVSGDVRQGFMNAIGELKEKLARRYEEREEWRRRVMSARKKPAS